jgi:hypothetical protein
MTHSFSSICLFPATCVLIGLIFSIILAELRFSIRRQVRHWALKISLFMFVGTIPAFWGDGPTNILFYVFCLPMDWIVCLIVNQYYPSVLPPRADPAPIS